MSAKTEKAEETELSLLLGMVAIPMLLILLTPVLLWIGWSISILWGWFVVPLGLPAITISQAAGLGLIASLLRFRANPASGNSSTSMKVLAMVVVPPLSVAIGWFIKWLAL